LLELTCNSDIYNNIILNGK